VVVQPFIINAPTGALIKKIDVQAFPYLAAGNGLGGVRVEFAIFTNLIVAGLRWDLRGNPGN
jgi:hypothetical protein